jgi:hypothetical protein
LQQIIQNVIINRQEHNSIEFEIEGIEIPLAPGEEQTFEILVTNQGSPTHIHFSVSDELKGHITFLRDNPYVLHKEYVSAVARIPRDGKVLTDGKIFITAGYGSKKKGFPAQLGKKEEKPKEPEDEIQIWEDNDELKPYRPGGDAPKKKASNPGGSGSGVGFFSVPFLKKLFVSEGTQTRKSGNKTRQAVGEADKLSMSMAFGGFLLLVFLFSIYFVLPEGIGFKVSFTQALTFSILFVTCITYLLLKIMEDG